MSIRSDLPGVTPPGGPEPTLEWVRPGAGVVGALSARLGSDPRSEELLAAVMRCLRGSVAPDTWEGAVEELPYSLRSALRQGGRGAAPSVTDGRQLVEAVSGAMQHPPQRAAIEVQAVFATLKRTLPRGLADALAEELPPDLAGRWRAAR